MNSAISPVQRDERTVVVENASYRWSYVFISFGLLAIVACRSLMYQEAAWDLLALVILGSGMGTVYQGFHKVLSRPTAASLLVVAVAAGLGFLIAWLH